MSCYLHTTALRRGETASVTRPENWMNPSTGLEASVKKGVLLLPGVKLKFLSRPAHSLGIYGTIPAPLSSASFYMAFRSTSAHFRAMFSPISFLQNVLPLPAAFQFCVSRESTASLQTACSHLLLGFPTCLILPKHLPIFFNTRIIHPIRGQPAAFLSGVKL